jgi:hypothetical protein
MRVRELLLSAFLLASCSTGEMIGPPGEPISLTPEMETNIKEAVVGGFKDPLSAQFRGLRSTLRQGQIVTCGEVNGKNSFGGYVGFKPFIATVDPKTQKIKKAVVGADYLEVPVSRECSSQGVGF